MRISQFQTKGSYKELLVIVLFIAGLGIIIFNQSGNKDQTSEDIVDENKNEVRIIDLGKVGFDADGNKIKPNKNDVTFRVIEVLRHKRQEAPVAPSEIIDLLIKVSSYDKEILKEIAFKLKDQYSDFTPNNCDFSLWDSKKAYNLENQRQDYMDEVYAKAYKQIDLKTAFKKARNLVKQSDKKHYVFVADHLIGYIPLGTDFFQYYPFQQDDRYKKLGGKNCKK